MEKIYKCMNCGSTNVVTLAWVKPNDNNSFSGIASDGEQQENWCKDCEEHVEFDVEEWRNK